MRVLMTVDDDHFYSICNVSKNVRAGRKLKGK